MNNTSKPISIRISHDPTRFGGIIHLSDFETESRNKRARESAVAKRILSDWSFDEQCRKNLEYRGHISM